MSSAIKIFIFFLFFCVHPVYATELDNILPSIGRSVYDKYDQPNKSIWKEYVYVFKRIIKSHSFISKYVEDGSGGMSCSTRSTDDQCRFQELNRMILPLYIEDDNISFFNSVYEEASEMYEQDTEVIPDMQKILDVVGKEETTDENGLFPEDETFVDIPVLFEDDQDIKEELAKLTLGMDDEEYLIMNEQEKINIMGGRGDMEDYLIRRDYDMQENTIRYLAKILFTKEKLKGLASSIPVLPNADELETLSLQKIMKKKKVLLDYLDQLWALKRQLEDMSYQFEIAKRGKNLNIKEPVIYRYEENSKKILPKIEGRLNP